MSVSSELLCSFELLKPLDSAALKNHIKKGRNKRNSLLSSPVSPPRPPPCLSLLSCATRLPHAPCNYAGTPGHEMFSINTDPLFSACIALRPKFLKQPAAYSTICPIVTTCMALLLQLQRSQIPTETHHNLTSTSHVEAIPLLVGAWLKAESPLKRCLCRLYGPDLSPNTLEPV